MAKVFDNVYKKLKSVPKKWIVWLLVALLAVFFVFFDEHSLLSRLHNKRMMQQLYEEIDYYQKENEYNKAKLRELRSSDVNLEKFAREQYYMKRDNEDIYLIDEDE